MRFHRSMALALGVALAPGAAHAGPHRGELAVLNLFGPMSLLGLSGLLAQHATRAAAEAGYAVTGPDAAEAKVGREALKKLAECDLKPACLAANASALGGGRLLAGALVRGPDHYAVRLVLVDLATGAAVASGQRQVLIASRQLDAQFDAMLPDLLAGKSLAPTRLALTSPQKHVRVSLDDRPLGELPLTIEVSPGRHELRVEKPAFVSTDRFVDVAAGTTTALALPLTLLPHHVDPDAAAAGPIDAGCASDGGCEP